MNRYELWVFLHVASVIVWIGSGTTLALISLYAQRARDGVLLERLTGLISWLGQRVFGPSVLAALAFGIVAARSGHWSTPLWIRLGYGAIAISLLLNVVRAPLLRRVRHGSPASGSAGRLLRALPLVELTVLYLAVADMVAKPTGADTGSLVAGGGVLGLAVVAAAVATARSRPALSS